MNSKKEVQHVYLVGAKSLGAYGGYETFVYKLTEYHQNKENIKYHVACKANGDGCMDESKFDGVTRINEHEFELHNAHCFKIDVPQIGPAQAIYYDAAALKACCEHNNAKRMHCPKVYIIPSVGLDSNRFSNLRINRDEYRASFGVEPKDHMVLSVGELSSRKNQKIIIEALGICSMLPLLHLWRTSLAWMTLIAAL